MQRSGSLLVMMMGLRAIAAPAQAQTKPVVTAEISYPSVNPASVEAGQDIGLRIQAAIAADAPGDATATVDPLGLGRSTFVFKIDKDNFYGALKCPAGKQCFSGDFTLDVRLAPGPHQIPITVTDSKGRSSTIQVPLNTTPPSDSNHDGLPDAWQREFRLPGGADDDPDGDGVSNLDEFRAGTNPIAKYTRLFAEGSSGDSQPLTSCVSFVPLSPPQYEEFTPVEVVYVGDNGRVAISPAYATKYATGACPLFRAVADRVVEIRVESLVPLAVERDTNSGFSLNLDPNYPYPLSQLANTSLGVQSPSRTWAFADGHTADGIDMFLLLFNPNSDPVTANLAYVRAPSTVVAQSSRVLPPGVRTTIWVNRDQADAVGGDVSVLINASDGILAERAFRYHSPGRTVPHDSVTRGAWQTSTRWYFPDMDSRGPFASSLVVMNPTTTPTYVKVTTQGPTAYSAQVEIALTGHERRELTLRDLPAPLNSTFGVSLEASNGVGIVAERVAFGATESGAWRRSATGATAAGTKWLFPNSGPLGFSNTDLVIMNVSDTTASVRIRSITRGFECCDTTDDTVQVPARATVHVALGRNDPARTIGVPVGSLTVESIVNSSGVIASIVVERTTYWEQDGVRHGRATSVIGNQVQ
jgi:hypothetical protein